MKVFVAKTLVESTDLNSCSVEVFDDIQTARKWADAEIDNYGMEYDGCVTERSDDYYSMQSGDQYVTIEIVECEVNTKE